MTWAEWCSRLRQLQDTDSATCARWSVDAEARKDLCAKKRMDKAAQEWKAWVTTAMMGGAGMAHRFARGETLDSSQVDAPTISNKREAWSELWQRDLHEKGELMKSIDRIRQRAQQESELRVPLSRSQVTRAIAALPLHTGLGFDRQEPSLLRHLKGEALDGLVNILDSIERYLVLPAQALLVRVALLPKPQGGDRPVSLLWIVYRILAFCRKSEVAGWDLRMAGPWDMAMKGRSALDAVCIVEVDLELATHMNMFACGIYIDAEKLYDNIHLGKLLEDAADLNYPLSLLTLASELYTTAPRIITCRSSCATSSEVGTSIIAG